MKCPRCNECGKFLGSRDHRCRVPIEERFWPKVRKTDGCWLWEGSKTFGYGKIGPGARALSPVAAHRVSYELLVGPIPEGMELDHLCRVPACVRPDHLEPVTHTENVLRGIGASAVNARKDHCKRGHPFDAENTLHVSGTRRCRTCADAPRRVKVRAPHVSKTSGRAAWISHLTAARRARPVRVTERERRAISLLIELGDHAAVAAALGITVQRSRSLVWWGYRKLGVHSREAAKQVLELVA